VIFIQAFFYVFAVGIIPVVPIFVKSYPINHRLKSHMWGLVLVEVISFVLTAFVCEKFDNINILLLVMAGAATVSLIGAYSFKAFEDNETEPKKLCSELKHDVTIKDYFQWQKLKA
jgi:hypothetical protein